MRKGLFAILFLLIVSVSVHADDKADQTKFKGKWVASVHRRPLEENQWERALGA